MKITDPNLIKLNKERQWEHFCKTPPYWWNVLRKENTNHEYRLWRVCYSSTDMFYAEIVKEVDFKLYLQWFEKGDFLYFESIYQALAKVEEEIEK